MQTKATGFSVCCAIPKAKKAAKGKNNPEDLKIVEGIGPKIEEHLKAGGIMNWEDLSTAEVSRLQEILDAAGPRYNIHTPDTWPAQAKMAHEGKWDELKVWQDELDGGK